MAMNCKRQTGVTMIEVLITILILAIGLTGVMSMEAIAIKTNHQAYLRTQAILQVQAMADRMHANLKGVDDGNYVMGTTPTTPTQNCLTGGCTPAQMAIFDKWEWDQDNKALLPDSTATITYDSVAETHTITVNWKEEGNDAVVNKSFSFVYKPLPLYLL